MIEKFSEPELRTASDRACVIVGCANVEAWLEKALRRHFVHSRRHANWFFRDGSALSSFEAKIRMAHLSGLLSEAAMQDLLIVKDIRDLLAPQLTSACFDNPAVVHQLRKLNYLVSLGLNAKPDWVPTSNRGVFELAVYAACDCLSRDFGCGMPDPIA